MESSFSLSQIEQIAQPVRDLERAVAFYRDTLGVKFLFTSNGLAFFDCGGVRLMLSRPESPEFDHPGSVLYFKVADIHQTYAALLARGVTFIDTPHLIANMGDYDLYMSFFPDGEGNTLALSGSIPHKN